MADETKTVYLPRMRTRPGFTHSYKSAHGIKVVTVDQNGPVKDAAKTTTKRPRD